MRKRIQKAISSLVQKTRYSGRVSLVFVLAIGWGSEDPEQRSLEIGAHGGSGRVASVMRSCNGATVHSESSSFSDASVSATLKLPTENNGHARIGVRGGTWSSDAIFADRFGSGSYGATDPVAVSFSYLNPFVSWEGDKFGIGVGYIAGDVPSLFKFYERGSSSHTEIHYSGHLRFGNLNRGHFIMSIAEGEPLYSSGGVFDMGVGYAVGKTGRMYTGLTFGFYDQPGLLQKARFDVADALAFEVAGRWGSAGGESEVAISGGVVFTIGAGSGDVGRRK